ncbi:MAG TPA: RAMP superfamily CRISPR-associated protein, partial [Candidatus Hydrogenedentes bacterium]|nr:RAMP superfamily CRISPR-associated protein [Candidatus Hydrogenedentota bacterium]
MTNTDRQSGVFRITPVSPIHIGSGEVLTPMDYVLDGKMYKVKDVRKYFEDHIDDPDTAMKAVRDGLPLGPNYVRYELSFYGERPRNSTGTQGRSGGPPGRRADEPMFQATQKFDPQMKKLMKQAQAKSGLPAAPPPPPDQPKDKGSEVREFIKDPFGKPYIPGSSLKGCLRTALAFVLSESERPGPEVLNNIRS